MVLGCALLFFGAIQHAGVGIGPLREPKIIPAIAEIICGLALLLSAIALLLRLSWKAAMVACVIALTEVVLEIVASAILAGPQTASNHSRLYFPDGYVYTMGDDRYHGSVLVLMMTSLLILIIKKSALLSNDPR
jgi:hypothetical protein